MCIVKNAKRLRSGGGGDDNTDNSRFVGRVLQGIPAFLKANRGKIMQKDLCKVAFLSHILDSLGEEDVQEMDKLNVKAADEQLRVPHLRLMRITNDNHPRVGLYLYDLADMYVTATHIFV